MDEILYGGGQSVPVRAGDQPDESNVISDMFFIAPEAILASDFESIVMKPIKIGEELEPVVYAMITFKGKVNNENRLGSFTVLMSTGMMRALFMTMRKQYADVPIEYRTED